MQTTIRVDRDTHRQLTQLAGATGSTMTQVVTKALAALYREQRARRILEQVDNLKSDPDAWADYTQQFDAAITDGIGDGSDR